MGFNDHLDDDFPFTSIEKNVCQSCVIETVLAKIVQDNLSSNRCDYCGKNSDELVAAPFDIVMERIYASIATEYADAQDLSLPWNDGAWIMNETEVYDIISEFDPGWSGEFIDDVIDSLGGQQYWVPHSGGDWAVADPAKTLWYGWESFKNQILRKTRYLFLSEPYDDLEYGRPDYIPISHMLDALGSVINRIGLVKNISAGALLYRVRAADKGQEYSSLEEVGVPPYENARAGRMNPAGIPFLYLALDQDTAALETITSPCTYGVASFAAKNELRIVDLMHLPEPPSHFSPELYEERHEYNFIREFQYEISMPVSKNGREHIDYVPTQVVSEYLRHRFTDMENQHIDGILFPSVKNPGGVNLALFISENKKVEEVLELVEISMKSS